MAVVQAIKDAMFLEFGERNNKTAQVLSLSDIINQLIYLKMFILNVVFPLCFVFSLVYGDETIPESEILEWEAPDDLKTKFPYYLSGYDYDGSPVFVFEAGKWDIRSAVESGPEAKMELDKWMTQIMLRIRSAGNEALGSPGAAVIIDIEGLGIAQLGHVGVLELMLKQFPKFHQLAQLPGIKKIYIINAHYLYKGVYEVGKPMLGEAANLIELYGTNPGKWKPILLKEIPAEELPAWYGGSKSHQPVKVFG